MEKGEKKRKTQQRKSESKRDGAEHVGLTMTVALGTSTYRAREREECATGNCTKDVTHYIETQHQRSFCANVSWFLLFVSFILQPHFSSSKRFLYHCLFPHLSFETKRASEWSLYAMKCVCRYNFSCGTEIKRNLSMSPFLGAQTPSLPHVMCARDCASYTIY